jgi:hypothetical protein
MNDFDRQLMLTFRDIATDNAVLREQESALHIRLDRMTRLVAEMNDYVSCNARLVAALTKKAMLETSRSLVEARNADNIAAVAAAEQATIAVCAAEDAALNAMAYMRSVKSDEMAMH